ncbi:MAG: transglutaminase family protein [Gammaproteobacteria bacterium]
MQFEIRHLTTYRYDKPVQLGPHILRLTPRADGNQRLLDYHCTISPQPSLQSNLLDAEGNLVTRLWFTGTTTELCIASTSRVITLQDNPYDYIVDTPATALPMPYSQHEAPLLTPYRHRGSPGAEVVQLATSLARQTKHNTLAFLGTLNSFLHTEFEREIRPQGPPKDPEHTLVRRRGACRDLAALFIAICRSQGIAARFVSGYQARPETPGERRYLHAWPEVYIPGGGWRGYDPGHGTAVADAHVSVAAAGMPAGTLPVEGSYYADEAQSVMEFELSIDTDT